MNKGKNKGTKEGAPREQGKASRPLQEDMGYEFAYTTFP